MFVIAISHRLAYFPCNSVNTTVLCCDMFLYVLLLVFASESKRERSEGPSFRRQLRDAVRTRSSECGLCWASGRAACSPKILHQNELRGQLANTACLLLMVSARAILKMPYVMKELVKFIDEKENVLECHRRTSASASASKRSSRARTAACVRYIQHIASLLCYSSGVSLSLVEQCHIWDLIKRDLTVRSWFQVIFLSPEAFLWLKMQQHQFWLYMASR